MEVLHGSEWFLFVYFYLKMFTKGKTEGEREEVGTEEEEGLNDGWVRRWVEQTLKIVSTQQIHTVSLLYYLFLTPLLIFNKYFYGSW